MKIELASGHTVLADDADMELLLPHSWYLPRAKGSDRLYASARIRGTPVRIRMHRLLMDPPPGMVVHHINNDGLDNRRCNLEITTTRQNLRYHYDALDMGAYFDKQSKKWRAQLRDNSGKLIYLGLFDIEAEAREAAREFRKGR